MKRMHTAEQYRADHHERATFAVKFRAAIRRATAPLELRWIAHLERNADEHFEDLASSREWMGHALKRVRAEQVRLAARRQQIERGL